MTTSPLGNIAPRPTEFGPNILLMGAAGSGKTYSIRTLLEQNLTVFALFTEPRWAPLIDFGPSDGFHLHYVSPGSSDWNSLVHKSKQTAKLTWDMLVKQQDPNKAKYDSFVEILENCANFKCQLDGKDYGDVTTWGPDCAFVLDSLSGLNDAAMQLIVGGAISKSQPQWGAAQSTELELLKKITNECQCWFILNSHIRKQMSEITGQQLIQVSAIGQAIAGEIPKQFDEVVYAKHEGNEFLWSTMEANMDLKATYLPVSNKLAPSYEIIRKTWETRKTKGAAA